MCQNRSEYEVEAAHDIENAFIRRLNTSVGNYRDSLTSHWATGAANMGNSSIKFNYLFTQSVSENALPLFQGD